MDLSLLPDFQNHPQLAAWLTGRLSPYLCHLGKGVWEKVEGMAEKELAEGIRDKAKALLRKIRGMIPADELARGVIERYEADPEDKLTQRRMQAELVNLWEEHAGALEAMREDIEELKSMLEKMAEMQGGTVITHAAQSVGDVSGGSTVTQIQGNGNQVS
jgi:hypothetical protein